MTITGEVMPVGEVVEKGQQVPKLAASGSEAVRPERGRNRSRLISGIVSMNVVFIGCALVTSSVFSPEDVSPTSLQIFLSVLILLTMTWIVYYLARIKRKDKAVRYKDSHAGPVWLRGGLVLFGVCSLIMDVFKISNYVGYMHCESPMKIVFPAVQALFIIIQTYFLWFHAKDCVQQQKSFMRCGLMFCLSTNLVVWMNMVTEESLHQTPNNLFPNDNSSHRAIGGSQKGDNSSSYCKCSHGACDIFKKAFYYLYPFNIEYSLFAATMTYVMWKNVGRLMDQHEHHHRHRLRLKGILVGPVVGVIMLVAGIATFVLYEVDIEQGDRDHQGIALMTHYVMNTVTTSVMSMASLVGCTIYWLDNRNHVSEKNPTRSLDVCLLLGASLGHFLISYFTVVAVTANGPIDHINALNLTNSVLTILQLILQNAFIIEGLHREPFKETHTGDIIANPHALHGHQEVHHPHSARRSTSIAVITTGMHVPVALGLCWKRRVLKEISVFLLLCNILLWILPAFGARPQFDNSLGFDFYDFNIWSAVVNIGLPFGIFYRMHSVASLFEVFLTS